MGRFLLCKFGKGMGEWDGWSDGAPILSSSKL